LISQNLKSLGNSGIFGISENLLYTKCKGKYALSPDGELKLLSIQEFSEPRFKPTGFELERGNGSGLIATPRDESDMALKDDEREAYENKMRSIRRAKIACFDMIQCNPELDTFVTMTLSPDAVGDRASWGDAYAAIRSWLSNRVQRRGLKYILVPEYHHDGKSIHFHSVMNADALKLDKARYPDSGRLMYHKGQQVYNLADFEGGFSTAKLIGGEDATDKVAKYIFKYMGKQMGAKIGGRYYLHGGQLRAPLLRYADDPAELIIPGAVQTHEKNVEVLPGLTYKERYYV
jgi:hypothetical protein